MIPAGGPGGVRTLELGRLRTNCAPPLWRSDRVGPRGVYGGEEGFGEALQLGGADAVDLGELRLGAGRRRAISISVRS